VSDDAAPTPVPLPVLRIVRGIPDNEDGALEVAVLTAVLAARGGAPEAAAAPVNAWNPPSRRVRPPVVASPDGWRLSALPR
jgi:hypothetical protein